MYAICLLAQRRTNETTKASCKVNHKTPFCWPTPDCYRKRREPIVENCAFSYEPQFFTSWQSISQFHVVKSNVQYLYKPNLFWIASIFKTQLEKIQKIKWNVLFCITHLLVPNPSMPYLKQYRKWYLVTRLKTPSPCLHVFCFYIFVPDSKYTKFNYITWLETYVLQ